jgi:hypothetical protein
VTLLPTNASARHLLPSFLTDLPLPMALAASVTELIPLLDNLKPYRVTPPIPMLLSPSSPLLPHESKVPAKSDFITSYLYLFP